MLKAHTPTQPDRHESPPTYHPPDRVLRELGEPGYLVNRVDRFNHNISLAAAARVLGGGVYLLCQPAI